MLDELKQAIAEARRKNIQVVAGTAYSVAELDALEHELGVRFPQDFRAIALELGALSFSKGDLQYVCFGKPSAASREAGLQLDLLELSKQFRAQDLEFEDDAEPAIVTPIGAKVDPQYGHFEVILADANGSYRTVFGDGEISSPRRLVDVIGLFPYFVMMFDDDGNRLSVDDLLDRIGVHRG
jgi:hypothetical protein